MGEAVLPQRVRRIAECGGEFLPQRMRRDAEEETKKKIRRFRDFADWDIPSGGRAGVSVASFTSAIHFFIVFSENRRNL